MYQVQYFDYDEGTAARWYDIPNARFESRQDASEFIRKHRANWEEQYYECSYSYRVVEVGTAAYYSQPTDRLEY